MIPLHDLLTVQLVFAVLRAYSQRKKQSERQSWTLSTQSGTAFYKYQSTLDSIVCHKTSKSHRRHQSTRVWSYRSFRPCSTAFQKSATYLSKCKLSGAAVPHGHLSPPLLIKFRFSGSGTLTAKMVSSIQNYESKLFKSSQTTALSSQQSMTEAS